MKQPVFTQPGSKADIKFLSADGPAVFMIELADGRFWHKADG
jgi:hypothetical protein